MIDSMNPAADVAALASVEVDISNIKVGEEKKVMWRGKPVFIKRREKWAIEDAQKVKLDELKEAIEKEWVGFFPKSIKEETIKPKEIQTQAKRNNIYIPGEKLS